MPSLYNIAIVSAPSILGLRSFGVEKLGESLLAAGLQAALPGTPGITHVPTLNHARSGVRDRATQCLNPQPIRDFSLQLMKHISNTVNDHLFPLVLGGDCSILLGIMPALAAKGKYGLIFIDAHADFYAPHQSTTGEVADMDLAIVTGRGPDLLTNINGLKPYVQDEHVVHIGQRDQEETRRYHSQEITETAIHCFTFADIEKKGVESITRSVIDLINELPVEGYWIHFDTDVLSDSVNPAVDYRLPGGLAIETATSLLRALLATGKITGMGITIFNPSLDKDGRIAHHIVQCLEGTFDSQTAT
jgi:arginase